MTGRLNRAVYDDEYADFLAAHAETFTEEPERPVFYGNDPWREEES